jgi:AcrR family transcriptional regulator
MKKRQGRASRRESPMPRTPAANRDIRDQRREDILHAAAKLFAKRGFTDTKIGDIAEAAHLSHGLVYHYFPSKEAIFEEIVSTRRKQAWARIDEAVEQEGAPGAIRRLLELSLADALERPEVTLMVTHALLSDAVPDRVRASIRRGAKDGFDRSVALLERGQARGEVDRSVPAEELASAIFCLLRGVVLTTVHRHRGHAAIPVPGIDTIMRLLEPAAHERATHERATHERAGTCPGSVAASTRGRGADGATPTDRRRPTQPTPVRARRAKTPSTSKT